MKIKAMPRVVRRAHTEPHNLLGLREHNDDLRFYRRIGKRGHHSRVNGARLEVRTLLDHARLAGLPVIFTTIAFGADGVEGQVWRRKMPALECLVEGSDATRVDGRLGRRAAEPVVVKRGASAFGGTGLPAMLVALGADSLVVTGATTSGCVRATVVDACMAGYRTVVPAECVGDRHAGAHAANLFDMQAKYADVLTSQETSRLLETAAVTP